MPVCKPSGRTERSEPSGCTAGTASSSPNSTRADADAKDYDGDLDEARRRIEALHPSITVFTGGGYQGYVLLEQPLAITDENRADVKRTLQGIAKAIGSDPSVAELARIMRLPGTINTKPGRNGAFGASLDNGRELI